MTTTTKVRLADGQDIPLAMPAKRVIARLAEATAESALIRFPASNGIPVWINPQYIAAVWQMPGTAADEAPEPSENGASAAVPAEV